MRTFSNLTKVQFKSGVSEIKLCDLKSRNSLSIAMMQNLINNITEHQNNEIVRAIVISAEGPVFSAGHNLKELAKGRETQENVFKLASQLMCSLIDCPVPVIAKIDGMAAAAGCQLVAQCDIAVCSETSAFSTPGANFGIFCSTPGVALARCVTKMSALYMLLTGLPVKANEAKSIGLVSKVCPSNQLDEEIMFICDAIKLKSRSVIELGKKFYYKQIREDVKKAYTLGEQKMLENLELDDSKEGLRSFTEKRRPIWN
ncbi:enoyl-CoA hydratase domain-containing protein 3, mitochondrial isoform X2 [Cylas formicarius]|nr:enoyl-CoA hydratase domain-containing protein 3, mitochondrial isoform X2 [Cylas formicarius]XP_060521724.1 enoyl-CoA hydratase domain-containing protein 3, mitochondrial isoform X2 [Cylas formicarius]